MAPGDRSFHIISWDNEKFFNNMKTLPQRDDAEKHYQSLGDVPKIIVSGETGDILESNGEQNMVD